MNRAASNLARRKDLWGTVLKERFFWAEGSEEKGNYTRQTSGLVIARLVSCGGWQGLSGSSLTTGDQAIPDWFNFPLLGEQKPLSLSMVMWGLARATPFWAHCLVSNGEYKIVLDV